MVTDAYDILFGQLDAEEIKKVNRSRNYAQALNLGVRDVYDGFDEVEQEFAARRDTWKAKGHDPFTSFNPDAPKGVDPMTGETCVDTPGPAHASLRGAPSGPRFPSPGHSASPHVAVKWRKRTVARWVTRSH